MSNLCGKIIQYRNKSVKNISTYRLVLTDEFSNIFYSSPSLTCKICYHCKMVRRLQYTAMCALSIFIIFYIWTEYDYQVYGPIIKSTEISTSMTKTYRDMKYILVWTNPKEEPITYLGVGNERFLRRRCPITKCYVTSNRLLFEDTTDFDVIIFHGKEIARRLPHMPKKRSTYQKYVYANMESSDYYPVCDYRFDSYFNWTWTYKLDSEVYFGYITIRNSTGEVIGPNEVMHWLKVEDMASVNEKVKEKLKNKSRIAAWFVSNCKVPSRREKFVNKVQKELEKYGMNVDIFGDCGTKQCPRNDMENCLKLIEQDYYFYFSFENSFGEDYVTEKLLHALQNYAVPVVFGAANYTRFMPDGMYLNAMVLGVEGLVKQMVEIMNDKEKYYDFFKWHNHYTYHTVTESPETDPFCKLCDIINDERAFHETSVYDDFKKWWNPPWRCG